MLADRYSVRKTPHNFRNYSLNDNDSEGVLPAIHEELYLRRGLSQPGGKLPLFDLDGQAVDSAVVRKCIDHGWAEPWFINPLKPDWLVCKLTEAGRRLVAGLGNLAG